METKRSNNNRIRELSLNEIEEVNGGLTPTEGLGAVGVVVAIAAAPITAVAAGAALAGVIGIAAIDIWATLN